MELSLSQRDVARLPALGTVLVVEDEALVRHMAEETVRALGYRVLAAKDGNAALEILKSEEIIDILFSDVVMPGGMNGVQLAIQARNLRPAIKLLLTSGYSADALAAQQHELEKSIPLLAKPYRPRELASRFEVLMAA